MVVASEQTPPSKTKNKKKAKSPRIGENRCRAAVPRRYPHFVDLGVLSKACSVRFDKVSKCYDLNDVVNVVARGRIAKCMRRRALSRFSTTRIRWSDGKNGGIGRAVVSAQACVWLIREFLHDEKEALQSFLVAMFEANVSSIPELLDEISSSSCAHSNIYEVSGGGATWPPAKSSDLASGQVKRGAGLRPAQPDGRGFAPPSPTSFTTNVLRRTWAGLRPAQHTTWPTAKSSDLASGQVK